MKLCRICGEMVELARQNAGPRVTCASCAQIATLIPTWIADGERLSVIVDGSYARGLGGAGLVLVSGSLRGEVIAHCSCVFKAAHSDEAEFQAIVRGRRWAPGVPLWSDCDGAIRRARRDGAIATFIEDRWRKPNHDLAHDLSVQGRQAGEIWVTPGATH